MKIEDPELEELLKRLHLAWLRRNYRDICDRAETEQWSYRDFLGTVVAEEIAHRQQTAITRRTRRAKFPFHRTIDDFDFTYQSTLKLKMLGSYLSADFVTDGRNLILYGRPGRGKTHLAIAVAQRAIENGFDVLFTTAAELIEDLSVGAERGELRDGLQRYVQPQVLVVDEVGYLALRDDAANVLYHVVNARYLKRKSMLFTTNKSLNAWGEVLHDPDLAAAIIDRVLERGRLISLDGPSVRTKHVTSETEPSETA